MCTESATPTTVRNDVRMVVIFVIGMPTAAMKPRVVTRARTTTMSGSATPARPTEEQVQEDRNHEDRDRYQLGEVARHGSIDSVGDHWPTGDVDRQLGSPVLLDDGIDGPHHLRELDARELAVAIIGRLGWLFRCLVETAEDIRLVRQVDRTRSDHDGRQRAVPGYQAIDVKRVRQRGLAEVGDLGCGRRPRDP